MECETETHFYILIIKCECNELVNSKMYVQPTIYSKSEPGLLMTDGWNIN